MSLIKNKSDLFIQNSYIKLPQGLYSKVYPEPVKNPKITIFNESLAKDLKLNNFLENTKLIKDYLSGNKIPKGSIPISQAYAGHQFGHFTMLGDGRAVLIGELTTKQNNLVDLQLKGSGRTPYSRQGDGRATLVSMLREYIISEAMYYLNIPTTRSLAVINSGEKVFRESELNGGILTRIASSHIRVGTFEYIARTCSKSDLIKFTKYVVRRHFPSLLESKQLPVELLKEVMLRQIDLIVNWLRVGFIHGVMNTDNMSIPGETIDYGPCAFMNKYNPDTVFSSIDRNGRYSFLNQPNIGYWNLSVFAGTLLSIISDDRKKSLEVAKEVLSSYSEEFSYKWHIMMAKKLGINQFVESDKKMILQLLDLMEKYRIDYTNFFVGLRWNKFSSEKFYDTNEFQDWYKLWKQRVQIENNFSQVFKIMESQNPIVIPRNHLVENALLEVDKGDNNSFNKLLKLVSDPFNYELNINNMQTVPDNFDETYKTFCGT